MALKKVRLKPGMGGSKNGRGRTEDTETMKEDSKKPRRLEGKQQAEEGLQVVVDTELQDWLDEHNGGCR